MVRPLIAMLVLSTSLEACASKAVPTSIPAIQSYAKVKKKGGFANLDGAPVSLGAYAGRPVVLVFLGTHNDDVDAEIPNLLRLSAAYQPHQVTFLTVGEGAEADELRNFAEQNDFTFPIWQDPGGAEMVRRNFTTLPAHQFIDRAGQVIYSRQGFMSRPELISQLERLIK